MDAKAQVAAARSRALAVAVVDRVTLAVAGPDRVSWLNGLVTCDLVKLGDSEARYGLFVARSGRVLADAFIVPDDSRILVSVPARTTAALKEHLDHYRVMEDADVTDEGAAVSAWAVHGPAAAEVLMAARAAGGAGGALDRTGLGGAVVFFSGDRRRDVGAALDRALSAVGGAVGDAAGWQALRLERGVPEFGVDFGETSYPQEAAIEHVAVSFQKGCYLGQEVVCMLQLRGHVKRKLASLLLEAGAVPRAGAAVVDETGASAGEVTSACESPTLGRPVALAMLKRAAADPGRLVTVEGVRGEVVGRLA